MLSKTNQSILNGSAKVSVIVPTFNRKNMVCEAIDSVLKQTYHNFELIVVDDGSTDGTMGAIEAMKNPIISYIRTENYGVSAARNRGIKEAKGRLIAFLDSDDLWTEDKLEYQVEYMISNPDCMISQTEEIWMRRGKRVNPKNIHKKYSGWVFEKSVPRCIISPSAVMIRREVFAAVGMFDEKMPACEDYDLWLRASLKYPVETLPEAKIIKRGGHDDQLSAQWGLDIWRIYSLERLLASGRLDEKQASLVEKDILRRKSIVVNGALKRRSRPCKSVEPNGSRFSRG